MSDYLPKARGFSQRDLTELQSGVYEWEPNFLTHRTILVPENFHTEDLKIVKCKWAAPNKVYIVDDLGQTHIFVFEKMEAPVADDRPTPCPPAA